MTTITREQLRERARRKVKELEFAITQSAFTSIRDGLNDELELARIALASLEREQIRREHAEWSDMQFLLWDAQRRAGNTPVQSPIDHGYRPECECSGCKATARICAELNNEEAEIFADGYNAAMQSFGNSEQLNSPVTPDGWISCSERMPDNDEDKPIAIFTGNYLGQGVFVAAYDDDGFFDFWEGGELSA